MPGKAAKVIITEKQQAVLESFARSRTVSVSLVQRSKIILLAFEGNNNEAIQEIVDLHHDAVGRWRRRWRDAWQRLVGIECAEDTHVLEKEIIALLADRQRSGRPARVDAQQQAAIFKTACEDPKKTTDRLLDGAEANCVCT